MKYMLIHILLSVVLLSCDPSLSTSETTFINDLGIHKISENIELHVFQDAGSKVRSTLSQQDKIIIQHVADANIYERWFYLWEDNNQVLWFWSTDKGGCKWVKDFHSIYQKASISSTDAPELPTEFWNNLPNTIKERWASARQNTR